MRVQQITVIVACCLGLLLSALRPAAAVEVRMAVGDWEPYVSSKQVGNGAAAEIVRRAFALSGVTVHLEFYPWVRCETMVERGVAFATFPYIATKTRSKWAEFCGPLFSSEQLVFFRKDRLPSFTYSGPESLLNHSIGGTAGYAYVDILVAKGFSLDMSPDEESVFKKLVRGRVDLAIAEKQTGLHLLRQLAPGEFDLFGTGHTPFQADDYWLMVSKKYPNSAELQALFNAGLLRLRESGEYETILHRHFPAR